MDNQIFKHLLTHFTTFTLLLSGFSLLTIIPNFNASPTIVSAQENAATVNASDYALGMYYPFYDYNGVGNEFAPFSLTLDYRPDENRIYQVSRANSGNTISYVYQITDEGIYELAYFPNSYDGQDFRGHADALDAQKSLYLPATLQVGDTFNRGYRKEQSYTVTDILAEYNLDGTIYENVLVIESNYPEGQVQRFYYAPQIGEIYSEYIYDEAGNSVTTSLDYYGELPEEEGTAIDTYDYALGLFYPFYDYSGSGIEFAPFSLTLDYGPDENGIYQVSRANAGNTISFVYQLTEDRIYELAYFPNSYDGEDFRYHADAQDMKKSLYLPAKIEVGNTFKRGYRQEQVFTVTDILAEFDLGEIQYENVVVVEARLPEGQIQRYYYAPDIGEIYSEYIDDESESSITTSLSYYGDLLEQ